MLSDWDIEQYATRTLQKEGFEAGAKWAKEALIKELITEGLVCINESAPISDKLWNDFDKEFGFTNEANES